MATTYWALRARVVTLGASRKFGHVLRRFAQECSEKSLIEGGMGIRGACAGDAHPPSMSDLTDHSCAKLQHCWNPFLREAPHNLTILARSRPICLTLLRKTPVQKFLYQTRMMLDGSYKQKSFSKSFKNPLWLIAVSFRSRTREAKNALVFVSVCVLLWLLWFAKTKETLVMFCCINKASKGHILLEQTKVLFGETETPKRHLFLFKQNMTPVYFVWANHGSQIKNFRTGVFRNNVNNTALRARMVKLWGASRKNGFSTMLELRARMVG